MSDLNYKFDFNLTFDQFNSLNKFIRLKPFKILECDKNIGLCLISNKIYETLALEHLNDKNFYLKMNIDLKLETISYVNSIIRELTLRKNISKSLLKKLIVDKGTLGNFRILPKLHKAKLGIRPIINYKFSFISNFCLLIDILLQPHVKNFSSFIKDSQNLIQELEKITFNRDSALNSCDFESLYTNIDLVLALQIITDFMKDKLDTNHLNIQSFNEILKIVLFNNYFKFENNYFKQIKGIAMGTKCGPAIANVVVNFFEEKFLVIHKPLFYKRFIDDIFLVVKKDFNIDQLKEFFKPLKLNICGGNEIVFLDLAISLNSFTGKTIFKIYIKPTNSFSYLSTESNHPNHIFKNIKDYLLGLEEYVLIFLII